MDNKTDLAIVAIMKNEAPYVKEWIEFHKLVGVQKFYIYDNESEDNLKEVLEPYIRQGIVEYTFFPGIAQQMPAYNDCVNKHREDVKWLAIIDADEFIVPVKTKTIMETLNEFERYPGIGINWVLYDTNGHLKKPQGGVMENFIRCRKNYKNCPHSHIKSIVQPSMVEIIPSPHYTKYLNKKTAVDENFNPITGDGNEQAFTPYASINKLRINHYWSKSYEETLAKINRGRAAADSKRKLEKCRYLIKINDYTYDYIMYRFVIRMHKNLFFRETCKWLYYKFASIFTNGKNHEYIFEDETALNKSKYCNKKWYLKTYKDVKKAKVDPIIHYLHFGWKEGRNPGPEFNTNAYLEANPDVKKANICPLFHYEKYGKKEGRKLSL